jgi:hypothetical protein
MTMPSVSLAHAPGLVIPNAKARHTKREVRHCIQVSGRLLPKVRASFTKRSLAALTKLQGQIFVNGIWALASDAPNVTSVAARVAEQPETIETSWDGKQTCLSSKAETFTNICEGVSCSMRLGNS